MIVILCLLLIIVIFYYLFIYKEKFEVITPIPVEIPNIIKGTSFDETITNNLPKLLVGDVVDQTYVSYLTQFNLKIFVNTTSYVGVDQTKEYYINNSGSICQKKLTNSLCLKKKSNIVNETVFKKKNGTDSEHLNSYTNSGLWQFYNTQNENKSKYVYYGHEIIIKNLGKDSYYLAMCENDEENLINVRCGSKLDIYCYSDIKDTDDYGKWIILPQYFDKYSMGKPKKLTIHDDIITDDKGEKYDFYKDSHENKHDIVELQNKKIKIKMDDKFLIINSKPINNKYVYLNFCENNTNSVSITCTQENNDISKETNFKKVIGSISNYSPLVDFIQDDLNIYNWGITATIFDVNIYDTLFVKGSINLGDVSNPIKITSNILKYIKEIPYHFDKEICLRDVDDTKKDIKCIKKEHIEILNGSRSINIKSTTIAKPFILYSSNNYTGRELRVGFDYTKFSNLPYIGEYNQWLNWDDNGKWLSLKIEGPYSAIIFSKVNFGNDDNIYEETETTSEDIQMLLSQTPTESTTTTAAGTGTTVTGPAGSAVTDNNNTFDYNAVSPPSILDILVKTNPNLKLIEPPGISDVRDFGDEWYDGIRSMIVRYKDKNGQYKELMKSKTYEHKCVEKYSFNYNPNIENTSKKNKDITKNLFTANLCKNGNSDQNFFITSDDDDKFTQSNIYDEDSIQHFHKHSYDTIH